MYPFLKCIVVSCIFKLSNLPPTQKYNTIERLLLLSYQIVRCPEVLNPKWSVHLDRISVDDL